MTKDDVVADSTRATPRTTYGMTKACGELLLSDYSRRGFVDGRACRLPSVIVRAGAPNAATTSCFSGVIREPLAGVDAIVRCFMGWTIDSRACARSVPSAREV